jgi:5,10-methylenetetrahydrofolate reductase
MGKKIAAGAQFIQTQYCFDMARLRQFMARVRDLGLDERCFILVGVGPLASAKGASWMRAHVPGIHIPDSVIARLEGAENQKREGKNLCIELIQEIREIDGVAGIHVMAYRQEELVSDIIATSGILRNRQRRSGPPAIKESSSA